LQSFTLQNASSTASSKTIVETKNQKLARQRASKIESCRAKLGIPSNPPPSSTHPKDARVKAKPHDYEALVRALSKVTTVKEVDLLINDIQKRKHQSRSQARDQKHASHNKLEKALNSPEKNFSVQAGYLQSLAPKLELGEETLSRIDSLTDLLGKPINVQHDVSDRVADFTKSATQSFETIGQSVPSLPDISNLVSGSIDDVKSIFLSMASGILVVVVISLIYLWRKDKENGSKIKLIIGLALVVLLVKYSDVSGFRDMTIEFVRKLYEGEDYSEDPEEEPEQGNSKGKEKVFHTQSGSLLFSDMLKYGAACLSVATIATCPSGKLLTSIERACTNQSKIQDGAAQLSTGLLEFLEKIVNVIRLYVLGKESICLLPSENTRCQNFMNNFHKLVTENHNGKLLMNVPNSDRVYTLWMEGNDILASSTEKGFSVVRSQLQLPMRTLGEMKARFEAANLLNAGNRQVPVTCMIYGASGVGKSAMTTALTDAILASTLPESELEEFTKNSDHYVYARNIDNGFHDGYTGQMVCVYDDFGQARDIAGNPASEPMEIIRATNLFQWVLHMASIEAKGNTYFNSKFLIASTNISKLKPDSIYDAEALHRRFDFDFHQVPRAEYCKNPSVDSLNARRLDTSKCVGGLDVASSEYHRRDPITKEYTGEILSFDQVVSLLVDDFHKKSGNFTSFRSDLKNIKEQYIKKRMTVQAGFLMIISVPKEVL